MTVNKPNGRIDWDAVVKEVSSALPWFEERGIRPTLRTMFYRLVSLEIIPNTEQVYKSLSSTTVKARKKGKLPWDSFSDEGRLVLGHFQEEYRSPNQYLQLCINLLKNASQTYTIPRWYRQPNYVEVWIEKQALADTFSSFLEGRDVKIVVNKGYAGWSFLYENCKRLNKIDTAGKQIHVLYFGDLDPSGKDMDRHLEEAFINFGLDGKVDFQRVAVTQEQVEEFNLPPIPNSQETIDKVNRDRRTRGFIEKYGKLIVVELDALLAIVPEEFKIQVQESVDQFFVDDIYQRVLDEHPPELIDRLVRGRVTFLD